MKCYLYVIGMLIMHSAVTAEYSGKFTTLSSWIEQFDNLPKNRHGADATKHSGFAACGTQQQQWHEFEHVLQEWLKMMQKSSLSRDQDWLQSNLGVTKPKSDFFELIDDNVAFQPFAQKLVLQPGNHVYIRGDLHGDIFSLLAQLKDLQQQGVIDNHFKIIDQNVWFAFLGDYVDRGQYGCEVLYTMMRLALANPERMIYVRGNHEDVVMQSRYGFQQEVDAKFDDPENKKHRRIARIYDFMPVVCYIGCTSTHGVTHYIQCCHGGIEIGYDPKGLLDSNAQYQLLGALHRKKHCQGLCHNMCSYSDDLKSLDSYLQDDLIFKNPRSHNLLGFMWNDFDVKNTQQFVYNIARNGGFIHGRDATADILKLQSSNKSKIAGIFRAHQHAHFLNDMMKGLVGSKGIFKLWHPYEINKLRALNGLVWTFNVGPDSVYGQGVGFDYDTYAKVVLQSEYLDWSMEVCNTSVL